MALLAAEKPQVRKEAMALRLEGGLFGPEFLALLEKGAVPFQSPKDFGLPKGSLQEEMALAYQEAKALWRLFKERLEGALGTEREGEVTRERWVKPFLTLLGYRLDYRGHAQAGGKTYPILYRADEGSEAPPVHVVPWSQELGKAGRGGRSPHGLLQDYLNASEALWGLVTNGRQLRLLRKTPFVRRQAYVEVDLEALMEEDRFGDFALVFRLLHRTRLPKEAATAHEAPVERYHQMAVEQGERARERLREAVEALLQDLGTGFLQGPSGEALKEDPKALYEDLLRLTYRILFLLVAEARGVLGGNELFQKAFSLHRLLRLAENREAYTEDLDLWLGLKALFELLRNPELQVGEGPAARVVGLEVLNGALFGTRLRLEEEPFAIENRHLLSALRHLAFVYDPEERAYKRVNYAALDVEELGSVYESLLDNAPQVVWDGGKWVLSFARSAERKKTGSYYTPDELVALVLKEALDPVVERKLKEAGEDPKAQEEALLSLKVIDPAAGSGHFLLGAARRLGRRLAQIRTGEEEPSPEAYRQAVRDVVRNCLYAVDLNPLAVELCRVALWMESHVPGRPLSFLDHRVKVGNSLVGVLDPGALARGIPKEAYEPKAGDEKEVAKVARKANEMALKGFQDLYQADFSPGKEEDWAGDLERLARCPEDTPEQVAAKAREYEDLRERETLKRLFLASDLWTAAFFQPLRGKGPFITTQHVWTALRGGKLSPEVERLARELSKRHRFFHWWVEFPDVLERGGFDVVLGNPPWGRLLDESSAIFIRSSGRFPFTAGRRPNTYQLFLELAWQLRHPKGRVGFLVPTGVAADASSQRFFSHLLQEGEIRFLADFENRLGHFPEVDSRFRFALVVLGKEGKAQKELFVSTFLRKPSDLQDYRRHLRLTEQEIRFFNPKTGTLPLFRMPQDKALNQLLYARAWGNLGEINHWKVRVALPFTSERKGGYIHPLDTMRESQPSRRGHVWQVGDKRYVTFLEAKTFHLFEHRHADGEKAISARERRDPNRLVIPNYLVREEDFHSRMQALGAEDRPWYLGFRSVARATDERTLISAALPKTAIGGKAHLLLLPFRGHWAVLFLANLNTLVLDYAARQKVVSTDLTAPILEQLPFLPPSIYQPQDLHFIIPRVLELTYTAWDLAPFAQDVWEEADEGLRGAIRAWVAGARLHPDTPPEWVEGTYPFPPFVWDEERRALLRAELDAYYARLYGLNRKQLRYILDPQDLTPKELEDILSDLEEVEDPLDEKAYRRRAQSSTFPGETFRVLKEKELRCYGFYRTRGLILKAYMAQGDTMTSRRGDYKER